MRKRYNIALPAFIFIVILSITVVTVKWKLNSSSQLENSSDESIESPVYHIENNYCIYNHYEISVPTAEPVVPDVDNTQKVSTNYVEFTDDEIIEFAKLLWYECRGECKSCQRKTASAVVNRVLLNHQSLHDTIHEQGQFEPAAYLEDCSLTEDDIKEQIKVVKYIMKHGPTIPEYVLYFREGRYHKWEDMIDYSEHCTTYFSYDYNDYVRWSNTH